MGGVSATAPDNTLVSIKDLTKSYFGTLALRGADLRIQKGEIHGLVGENGAGKSTLIKVLSGMVTPDSGKVEFCGETVNSFTVQGSEALGISVVHQESTAFRDLGVTDNLFVGREIRRFSGLFLDKPEMDRIAKDLLTQLQEDLPLNVPLGQFSIAQQQMVAIARALSLKSKLLILDEPTASLSTKEADILHRVLRNLRDSGVGILFVSHRLEEVLDCCDQVTVLRDGRTVDSRPVSDWSRKSLILAMVGREVEEESVESATVLDDVLLKVEGLSRGSSFENVSFEVSRGEILGLGGLVGAGRTEVARVVFGVDKADSGTIVLEGEPIRQGSISSSIARGIALVPEDRQHQGLVLELSVATNMIQAVRRRLSSSGWINTKEEERVCSELIAAMSVKARSSHDPAKSLSGGNQQKVVLGKWLAMKPKLLILDEPTRGVDIGSKAEIHALVRHLATEGTAVLLISSDMSELLSLSDRIVVLNSGKVSGSLVGSERTSENVLELAFGKSAG